MESFYASLSNYSPDIQSVLASETITLEEIFEDLCLFISENDYPPTIPELQSRLNIGNPGTIHTCFKALEKKGYISRVKGMHRGMDLTEEAKRKYLQ